MAEAARISELIANFPAAFDRPSPDVALELPAEISFDCHGCRFSAVAENSPDGAVVSVEGIVGAIPFSAESSTARARTRELLAARPSSDIVRLELDGRSRIMLRGQAPLGDKPSPTGAIAAASAVLAARPCSRGRPPGRSRRHRGRNKRLISRRQLTLVGTTKIWPG